MKYAKLPLTLLALALLIQAVKLNGQSSPPALSLDNSPVEDQFQYVYKNSNDFEEFKMIRRWHFTRLKSHVLDSITQLKNDISSQSLIIDNKEKSIDSLISVNAAVQAKLDKAIQEKESLSLLGIMMQKTTYSSIVWSIIALLTGALFVFLFLFKRSNFITVSTKHDLSELKLEYEAFRKRALEREEGIVRKYHNELNKYKTKTGKLSQ